MDGDTWEQRMAHRARRAAKLRELRERRQAAEKPNSAHGSHFEQVGPMLFMGGFKPGTLISVDPRLKKRWDKN